MSDTENKHSCNKKIRCVATADLFSLTSNFHGFETHKPSNKRKVDLYG
jgi:hypothetical protein